LRTEAGGHRLFVPGELCATTVTPGLAFWKTMNWFSINHGLTIEMLVVKIFCFFGVYVFDQQSERCSRKWYNASW
jgi:hypothetical protein